MVIFEYDIISYPLLTICKYKASHKTLNHTEGVGRFGYGFVPIKPLKKQGCTSFIGQYHISLLTK